MKQSIFFILFCLLFTGVKSQNFAGAHEINQRLGRGINMGNTFEAPTETEWSNPWNPEYFKIMAELGFNHVRIPIRWITSQRSMAIEPYTIYPDFMNRIKAVIDTALKYQLHPIINMHHHEAIFDDPEGQKDRFLAHWTQISEFFKDYPDSLLFEVLNEPNGNLTPEKWNDYFAEALSVIRKTNPQRTVLLGTADWGGLGGISKLLIPDDQHLILTVHYYNPFQFTHQGAEWTGGEADQRLGTKWNDTEAERQTVINEFSYAIQYSKEHNIPIHVGEFGAYSKADIDSRARWTTFLSRWFEQQGFSWAYWEFSAGFGIYNKNNKTFITPLVDALLHNPMPDPVGIILTPVFENNFQNNNEGWNHWTSGGAQSGITVSNGQMHVNITNGGSDSWNVQLAKLNLSIEKGAMYRVSFKATAEAFPRTLSNSIGKATDPWTSYGSTSVTLTPADSIFSYTFTSGVDDNSARMTFDLGGSDIGISLSYVAMEKVTISEGDTTSVIKVKTPEIAFFPNPAGNTITVKNIGEYQFIGISDLSGKQMQFQKINSTNEIELNIGKLQAGWYIVNLGNERKSAAFRFVKSNNL